MSSFGTSASDASIRPRSYRKQLASEERQKLLLENLPEVRHVARRIHLRLPRHVPLDDLVNEGVVGLIDAVEKYDPTKNIKLRSYARFRIRGAILDSLREMDWGPRRLRWQARRIEQANRDLGCKLGRVPSEQEVAAQLGVPLEELQRTLKELHCLRVQASPGLSEPIFGQEVVAPLTNWAGTDPFEVCVRAEAMKALREAIEMLTERERQAVVFYYFEERTMKEIGRLLDVQESRISQIINKALNRLRTRLQEIQRKAG